MQKIYQLKTEKFTSIFTNTLKQRCIFEFQNAQVHNTDSSSSEIVTRKSFQVADKKLGTHVHSKRTLERLWRGVG